MGWIYDGLEMPEHEGAAREEEAWLLPFCACGWSGSRVEVDPQQIQEADSSAYTQWREHASTIAAKKTYAWIKPVTDAIRDLRQAAPLKQIRAGATIQNRLDSMMRSAVGRPRVEGKSWAVIGEQLGVTRESAWARFPQVDPADALLPEPGEPQEPPYDLTPCADLDVAERYAHPAARGPAAARGRGRRPVRPVRGRAA